jgi:hypothetical protein
MLAVIVLSLNLRKCCSHGRRQDGIRSELLQGDTDEEHMQAQDSVRAEEEVDWNGTSSINHQPITVSESRGESGFVGGVACLMIFSFSSFSTATLKLLNCQQLDGDRVLFYAGAKQCGVWQVPVYLLLVLLMCVPLVPVCVQALCMLPPSWRITAWARTKHWPKHPVMQAIWRQTIEPFESEHDYWAAMLMLQRLLTVACHALAPSELQSELGVAIVSLWFMLLQAVAQPYRIQWVNRLQLLSAWCLVMLTILNASSNSMFVSVGVNIADTPFGGLNRAADWLIFLLLWPPVAMLLICSANEIRSKVGVVNEITEQRQEGLVKRRKYAQLQQEKAQERRRHHLEKEVLQQEKKQERRRHQLEKEELQQEKKQLQQENAELLTRFEELQDPGEQ